MDSRNSLGADRLTGRPGEGGVSGTAASIPAVPGLPGMDALIRLDEVTKRYDGDAAPAVDGVSLQIAPGEAVAVMGPSGSGKSTLLNMIAGLDRPTSGTVTVAGERIDRLSETGVARFRRRQVGMIFQFFNLLDDMTVLDNILLPAQLAGMPTAKARARALAVGIPASCAGSRMLSSTVMSSSKLKNWKIMPTWRRRNRATPVSLSRSIRSPATVTVPLVGRSSPAIMFSSVDFPLPDGPITATDSPGAICMLTPSTAGVASPP